MSSNFTNVPAIGNTGPAGPQGPAGSGGANTSLSNLTQNPGTLTLNAVTVVDIKPELRLLDPGSGNYIGFKAPSNPTSYTNILPDAVGVGVLTNDGLGNLQWVAPAGTTHQVIFNLSGDYTGNNQFTYDNSGNLTLGSSYRLPLSSITTNDTTPSGVSVDSAYRDDNNQGHLAVYTVDDGAVDSVATGSLYFETGNKTAGTGNSGSFNFTPGTSTGGTRGSVKFNAKVALTSTAQTITAGQSILSTTSFNKIQAAGALSTSTSTVIAAGISDGQILQIVNVGSFTITLKSGGNTDLPGLVDYPLTASSCIAFIWSGSLWYTTSVSVN